MLKISEKIGKNRKKSKKKKSEKLIVIVYMYTPTPWLTVLLVLGKIRVKQNSC